MKTSFIAILVFFVINYLNAQQSQWLKGIHGSIDDVGTDITTDPSGNVLACGYFASDTIFAGNQSLPGKSMLTDAYVIKYDANGSPIWMDNPGGPLKQAANSLGADFLGNIYVTGYFAGGFNFGPSTLQALGNEDAMLLKYDSAGNNIWGVSLGSYFNAEGKKLAIDSEGNIYVGGQYTGTSISIGDTTLNNNGGIDVFLAKFDPDGSLLWAHSFGGNDHDFIWGMCVDKQDNVYITGGFHSQEITFGDYTFPNLSSVRASYVTKIDLDGNIQWADSHTDAYDQQYYGITCDAEHNIYISGYFKNTFVFGKDTLKTEGGQFDIAFIKYNSDFEPQWARQIHSLDYDRSDDLDHDNEGNIYLAALFFADIQFEDIIIKNNGGRDFAIAKYTHKGDLIWVCSAGDTGDEECSNLVFEEPWNIYFTGYFSSDYLYWGHHFASNYGMKDAYIGYIHAFLSTGIQDDDLTEDIHIYPNPFEENIIFSKQVYRAKLYDLNGRLILSEENTSKITVAKGLPPAIYLLIVTPSEKEQTQTFKVLKQ